MSFRIIVTTSLGASLFEEVKPAESYRQALTIFAEEIQQDHVLSVLLYVGDTKIAEFQPTRILHSEA